MRLLRYFVLLGVLILPAAWSHAQVSVGIGIGGPAYGPAYYAPPFCSYGYYGYYPYACAPYGYYGPSWFSGGVFIGAGPWLRTGYGYRGWYRRPGYGYYGRPRWDYRHDDGYRRGFDRGPDYGDHDRSFRGRGEFHGGGRRGGHGHR